MSKTVTATVMFTDVVASSKLRRGKGEAAAQKIFGAQKDLIREQVEHHSGREVKTIGDCFMVAFASARDAVNCAVAIQRAIEDHKRRGPMELPQVRIGINVGEVIEEEGDLFGLPVDAAEHIQSKAEGGEILVSELVRGVVGPAQDVQFEERGRFRLKNFPGRWRLYKVPWQSQQAAKEAVMYAFLICDYVGIVALYERLGDEKGLEVIRAYYAIIRAHLASHPVLWTKAVGDNYFAAFRSPRAARTCAIDMQKGFVAYNKEHLGEPLRVRIALHVGEVLQEADELFGRALNFAVRLSGVGHEGQIIASSYLKELAEADEAVRYGRQREVELRGFPGKHRVYEVLWRV